MGTIPVLKPKEVAGILAKLGFQEVRQRDGRVTTVPFHPGKDISPILLRQICKDIGLTAEAFIQNR